MCQEINTLFINVVAVVVVRGTTTCLPDVIVIIGPSPLRFRRRFRRRLPLRLSVSPLTGTTVYSADYILFSRNIPCDSSRRCVFGKRRRALHILLRLRRQFLSRLLWSFSVGVMSPEHISQKGNRDLSGSRARAFICCQGPCRVHLERFAVNFWRFKWQLCYVRYSCIFMTALLLCTTVQSNKAVIKIAFVLEKKVTWREVCN